MSLTDIFDLSVDERLDIIASIWNSVDVDKISLSEAQKTELNARIAADESGQLEWFSIKESKKLIAKR